MRTDCPCGSERAYAACCGPWHAGAPAPTAEALMRSRYTAFVMELEPYLLATWHPGTRPPSLDFVAGAGPARRRCRHDRARYRRG